MTVHTVQVGAVLVVQPSCHVGAADRRKPFIDVMENVFGGVRIMPEDEPVSRASGRDPRARPWLAGVTMSAVQVRLADGSDDEDDDRSSRTRRR
jgi:hypothetical protein